MPWEVTDEEWLRVETDRITSHILMHQFSHRAWTPDSLKAEMARVGLDYSMPDIQLINDELHRRGVVNDVPD